MHRIIVCTQAVELSLKDFYLISGLIIIIIIIFILFILIIIILQALQNTGPLQKVGTHYVFTCWIGVAWLQQIICCSVNSNENIDIFYWNNYWFIEHMNIEISNMGKIESKNYGIWTCMAKQHVKRISSRIKAFSMKMKLSHQKVSIQLFQSKMHKCILVKNNPNFKQRKRRCGIYRKQEWNSNTQSMHRPFLHVVFLGIMVPKGVRTILRSASEHLAEPEVGGSVLLKEALLRCKEHTLHQKLLPEVKGENFLKHTIYHEHNFFKMSAFGHHRIHELSFETLCLIPRPIYTPRQQLKHEPWKDYEKILVKGFSKVKNSLVHVQC